MRRERNKPTTDLSELTETVRKLALNQEEQLSKLSHLEQRITSPTLPAWGRMSQNSNLECHRCGRLGHIARFCRAVVPEPNLVEAPQPYTPADGRAPHPSQPFKRLKPMVARATMGMQQGPHRLKKVHTEAETLLVGPRNEGNVEVNGMECRALIDSGSQITSITHSYWQNHPVLKQRELQPSKIPIEGAGGQAVPYRGVLQVDLKVFGQENKAVPTFVILDSDYRSSVLLLVGTNVIRASRSHLQVAYDQQFLHRVKEQHPEWYTALLEALPSTNTLRYPSQWQDVRRLLTEMEVAGVICPSKSPYASPVVVVLGDPRKKKRGAHKSLEPDKPFVWTLFSP
ncbi:Retrovirus-related Pol poly from transposon [Solea senegalensis]|uniref:Retrovirus-related Pol poly from transposon n=1 Tax=Solea senegalensis TaxID=28829 RepID=A0AAV6S0L5_SOLSE|nr:Retrovirus-related Pol poly from transposon [Solea senegalensis]